MKLFGKKLLSIVICFIMIFYSVAVGGEGFSELLEAISIKASAETYKTGDTIYFGTYPQTDVTDTLGSVLNSQSGTWKSYCYYSGSGLTTDGQMTASDYMRYKDVTLKDEKYRGVTFDTYRPDYTGYQTSTSGSDNGYTYGNVYWFKYEPVKWRVIDPSTGLIMCDSIIDSQPYNNYILSADSTYWGDSAKTYYANNYAKSSIRQWLNNDFFNTAFSVEQKLNIKTTTLNNDGYYTLTGTTGNEKYDAPSTNDKIFLLSYDDVKNSDYGFSKDTYDSARLAKGSDYAKCQGLYVFNSSGSSCDGCSHWLLRSPGSDYYGVCRVFYTGFVDAYRRTNCTCDGIRPALKLQNLKSDYAGSDIEYPSAEPDGMRITVNNTDLIYTVGDEIVIAVSNFKDNIESSIEKLSVKSSDSNVVKVGLVYKQHPKGIFAGINKIFDKCTFIVLNAVSEGEAYVSLTNSDTGETRFIPFVVNCNNTGAGTYRIDNVKTYNLNETDEYNGYERGVYISDISYHYGSVPEGYYISMNLYNKNHCSGVVEVYDSEGNLKSIENIEKLKFDTQIYKTLYKGTVTISKEIFDGKITTFKSEFLSKKTEIKDMFVPAGGYFRVTCDRSVSYACALSQWVDDLFTAMSVTKSFFKLIKGIDSIDEKQVVELRKQIVKQSLKDKPNEKLKTFIKDISKKWADKYAEKWKEKFEKNITDTSTLYEIITDGLADLNKLLEITGIDLNTVLKLSIGSAVSVAEGAFTDAAGWYGLIIKGIFLAESCYDFYRQLDDANNLPTGLTKPLNYYTPSTSQPGILTNEEVKIKTNKNVPSETVLESYRIISGKKENINLQTGRVYSDYEDYQIALVKDGQYIQPSGPVEVFISSPYSKAIVARQNDDGSWEIIKSKIENGMLIFEVDHFCRFAVIENNPAASATLYLKSSASVAYRSDVTITATASNLPSGYFLAIYDGNTLLAKGDNSSVSYQAGEMRSSKTFTVKVVDSNGAVQSNSSGALQKDININVSSGFFAKIIAFFKALFGMLPKVDIKP